MACSGANQDWLHYAAVAAPSACLRFRHTHLSHEVVCSCHLDAFLLLCCVMALRVLMLMNPVQCWLLGCRSQSTLFLVQDQYVLLSAAVEDVPHHYPYLL
jgi:hypothetical protein